MRHLLATAVLAMPLAVSAQNLLLNGSFDSLANWTSSANGQVPPAVINTLPTVGTASGEDVAADPLTVGSPDLGGTTALYFAEDLVSQTVSQEFTVLTAGFHNWGFDYWVPLNALTGRPLQLSATIGTGPNTFQAGILINAAAPAQQWTHFGSTVFLGSAGTYTFRFQTFNNGVPSADMVLDRAFVSAVPEPGSYALMISGVLTVGFAAARRRKPS